MSGMDSNKTSVIINGITLTRAQVEAALAELNAPKKVPVAHRLTFDSASGTLTPTNTEVGVSSLQYRTNGNQGKRGIYLPGTVWDRNSASYTDYPITWSVVTDDGGVQVLIGEYLR